jgi:hypothetical protein
MRDILLAVLISACATGTQPHDMSVAGHEQAAREHERAADQLETDCANQRVPSGPCWKNRDKVNVQEHRDAAAQHRAASAALAAAEAQACSGISENDRVMSPFEHPADIASVEPIYDRITSSKAGMSARLSGANVTFRAVPGLTAEWLQRSIDCHLARNASLGHVVPEMPDCPLVPRGVSARVRSAGGGFVVEVRGDDMDTAREVLARAQRSVAGHPVSAR